MYCPPGTELVVRPYNLIADAILSGETDAGVMIHEELVHFPALGLRRVCDLGAAWMAETGLPLPVGLNLVRRSLGRETARAIARTCRSSLLWALDHDEEALAFARRFGRGRATTFIPMFSNDDTLRMADDVRRAMRVLFDRIAAMGLAPRIEEYEVIDD
jgi:1,4-dihydroxy-6-naphthoate synthase